MSPPPCSHSTPFSKILDRPWLLLQNHTLKFFPLYVIKDHRYDMAIHMNAILAILTSQEM